MIYIIRGSNGDEAEARSERAACLAARTLVEEDGNRLAQVYEVMPSGEERWVGEGRLAEGERYQYTTMQGRRR